MIRTERDGVEQVLSELVRPAGNIPKKIREITGITNEMVAGAETIDKVLPRVSSWSGTPRSSAHNAHFDRRFVEHNARLMGKTLTGNEWSLHDAHGPAGSNGRPVQAGGAGREAGRGGAGRAPGARRLPSDSRVYRKTRQMLGGTVSLAPMAPPGEEPAPVEVAHDADLSGAGVRVHGVPR